MENEILLLVFYIFRDTLQQTRVREEYMSSIKKHFDSLGLKTAIFFLPTDTEERIECLNPKYIEDQNDILKLKQILTNAEKYFDIQGKLVGDDDEKIIQYKPFSKSLTTIECEELDEYYNTYNHLKDNLTGIHGDKTIKKGILTFNMVRFLEITGDGFAIERQDLEFIRFIGETDVYVSTTPVFECNDKVYAVETRNFYNVEEMIKMIEESVSKELRIVIYNVNMAIFPSESGYKKGYHLRYSIID